MIGSGIGTLAGVGTGPKRLCHALDRKTAMVRSALRGTAEPHSVGNRLPEALLTAELSPLLSRSLTDYLAAKPGPQSVLPPQASRTIGDVGELVKAGRGLAAEVAKAPAVGDGNTPSLPTAPRRVAEAPDNVRVPRRQVQAATVDGRITRTDTAWPMEALPSRTEPPVSPAAGTTQRTAVGAELLAQRLSTWIAAPARTTPVTGTIPAVATSTPALPARLPLQPGAGTEAARPWFACAGPLGTQRMLGALGSGAGGRSTASGGLAPNEPQMPGGFRRLGNPAAEPELSERLATILHEQALRQGIDLS